MRRPLVHACRPPATYRLRRGSRSSLVRSSSGCRQAKCPARVRQPVAAVWWSDPTTSRSPGRALRRSSRPAHGAVPVSRERPVARHRPAVPTHSPGPRQARVVLQRRRRSRGATRPQRLRSARTHAHLVAPCRAIVQPLFRVEAHREWRNTRSKTPKTPGERSNVALTPFAESAQRRYASRPQNSHTHRSPAIAASRRSGASKAQLLDATRTQDSTELQV